MSTMESVDLNWDGHQPFSSEVLKNLLFDVNSSNVTLVSEDNKSVNAHSFVLSYVSPFFRDIFHQNPEKHLTLHLQGLKYESMVNLVKCVYLGQAAVRKEHWLEFITNATKWNLVKLKRSNNSGQEDQAEIVECENENLMREPSEVTEKADDLLKDVMPDKSIDTIDEIEIIDVISTSTTKEKSPILKNIGFNSDLCEKDFSNINNLIQHKRNHTTRNVDGVNSLPEAKEEDDDIEVILPDVTSDPLNDPKLTVMADPILPYGQFWLTPPGSMMARNIPTNLEFVGHFEGEGNDVERGQDGSESVKSRKKRIEFTAFQRQELEKEYDNNKYPEKQRRLELSTLFGMDEWKVKIWFQNRRRERKKVA